MHKPVLVESSPNQTVMAGMPAEFRCKFQTDLAMSTLWLRPTAGMMGYEDSFDRSDRDSYYIVKDGRGEPINSDTLREERISSARFVQSVALGQSQGYINSFLDS